jgi:type II secretory pathway pseudopilin PulG
MHRSTNSSRVSSASVRAFTLLELILEKQPLDGWKRQFAYFHPGQQGRDYDLISVGKDGEYGTEDDIRNWEIQ